MNNFNLVLTELESSFELLKNKKDELLIVDEELKNASIPFEEYKSKLETKENLEKEISFLELRIKTLQETDWLEKSVALARHEEESEFNPIIKSFETDFETLKTDIKRMIEEFCNVKNSAISDIKNTHTTVEIYSKLRKYGALQGLIMTDTRIHFSAKETLERVKKETIF